VNVLAILTQASFTLVLYAVRGQLRTDGHVGRPRYAHFDYSDIPWEVIPSESAHRGGSATRKSWGIVVAGPDLLVAYFAPPGATRLITKP
jgi:hypothetical protein